MYQAVLGAFTARDPLPDFNTAVLLFGSSHLEDGPPTATMIVYQESPSRLYEYARGNSLVRVDPLGLTDVKAGGMVFQVHRNDPDPFPSNPHAHSGRYKVDINTGEFFHGAKPTGRFLKRKILQELRQNMTKAGLLCIAVSVIVTLPEVVEAGQEGGALGIAQLGGDILVETVEGTAKSAAVGLAVTGGAALAGTTVTVSGTAVTGLVASTGVGGAVILTAGAGYAVGTYIGQTKVGGVSIHERLGNTLFAICPWCF